MQFVTQPRKILLLKPCCIGDVVMTTPLLTALRRAYPESHITWGVGTHSAAAIANHPLLDAILPTGPASNPAKSPAGMLRLVQELRAGQFDMAVVPVRSPLISLAVRLAGIPIRAGLDSTGRGRFYTVKAPVDPAEIRHESDIYLGIARALGLDTTDCWASTHVDSAQVEGLRRMLNGVNRLVVVHAGGGQNPGMAMLEKRPPIPLLSNVAARAAAHLKARIAILGGPGDRDRADELHESLHGANPISLVGILDFSQIAALGQIAQLVIGPDTGLLHLMAAAGAPTVMIFGPSDPRRYAPFVPPDRVAAPWRPFPLPEGGVASGPPKDWTWEKNGITANEVWQETQALLLHRDQDDRQQDQAAADESGG
jgi:ADP-heptose:LPS heptosyltransferase